MKSVRSTEKSIILSHRRGAPLMGGSLMGFCADEADHNIFIFAFGSSASASKSQGAYRAVFGAEIARLCARELLLSTRIVRLS